jgi:hypothetical protein
MKAMWLAAPLLVFKLPAAHTAAGAFLATGDVLSCVDGSCSHVWLLLQSTRWTVSSDYMDVHANVATCVVAEAG